MADWGNFYTLVGTVAGTLIGLLFVSSPSAATGNWTATSTGPGCS